MSGSSPSPVIAPRVPGGVGTPWIVARDLQQRGARGTVFGPLSCDIRADVLMIVGARGAGSTSLLLTLAGRMRVQLGELEVLGLDARAHARAIRRASGIAGFTGIDDLVETVTVADMLHERRRWAGPWYRPSGRSDRAAAEQLLAPVLSGELMPDLRTDVRDLPEEQAFLLRVGLALLEHPRLLVVDDLDHVHHPDARRRVLSRLAALPAHGVRVAVATTDPRDPQLVPDLPHQVITLTKDGH